jgi:thiol:disulfide interchange protein DsbG
MGNTFSDAKGATHVMSRKLVLPLAAVFWFFATWASAAPLPKYRQVANDLLSEIDQTTWVAQGSGQRVLYIFFDPNCPYCHQLYEKLSPMVEAKNLQLRWIPVGMLANSSLPKAAAILQAHDPLTAFKNNEENYDMNDDPGGGITPARQVLDKTQLDLAANLSLLQGQNIAAVPVVVMRATDGQGFMFQGVPAGDNLKRILGVVALQGAK